jgi:hypothetical protein
MGLNREKPRVGQASPALQNERKSNVVVDVTKIVDLYSNYESIIPKVEVAGSIPVSRCHPLMSHTL